MTPSIHQLTTAPTNSGTTSAALTDAAPITLTTTALVSALGWTTIAYPTATTDTLASFVTAASVV